MDVRRHLIAVPATREPLSLVAVERAIGELRRGRFVTVAGSQGTGVVIQAAEGVTEASIRSLAAITLSSPTLAITARRASVLGLTPGGLQVVSVANGEREGLTAQAVYAIADPRDMLPPPPTRAGWTVTEVPRLSSESAAVQLAKTARLLPAAIVAEVRDPAATDLVAWAARHGMLFVDAGDIFRYDYTAARSLRAVSEARVPLLGAEDARIVAFRPHDGGIEHLAVLLGDPRPPEAVLTRLHSECFTGDLLGSLRCDCGDQLRGAIREIAAAGGGLLLYLAQEGRGIGLVNKLRAYELQDRGFDTLDANEQLGFDADERVYLPAAEMLRQLGFDRVRLLTNNPAKVNGLARCGIEVVERVPHAFPSNHHNERYMQTKAARGGHLL